jgi:hypothetical protein
MRVLIDSSVWIDFFRGRSAPHTDRLRELITAGEDLCLCGHVLAEVLRGTRHDEQYRKIERRFKVLEFLTMTASTFKASADIYRHLRKRGLTLKNAVDTFIAAVALEQDVHLLHDDSDFDLIAREFPLKVYPTT